MQKVCRARFDSMLFVISGSNNGNGFDYDKQEEPANNEVVDSDVIYNNATFMLDNIKELLRQELCKRFRTASGYYYDNTKLVKDDNPKS